MTQRNSDPQQPSKTTPLDYVFYALAGGVFLSVGFSFVLWLQF